MDESKKIFYEVMHDVNILFGKIFSYNYELLALCNDNNYTRIHKRFPVSIK